MDAQPHVTPSPLHTQAADFTARGKLSYSVTVHDQVVEGYATLVLDNPSTGAYRLTYGVSRVQTNKGAMGNRQRAQAAAYRDMARERLDQLAAEAGWYIRDEPYGGSLVTRYYHAEPEPTPEPTPEPPAAPEPAQGAQELPALLLPWTKESFWQGGKRYILHAVDLDDSYGGPLADLTLWEGEDGWRGVIALTVWHEDGDYYGPTYPTGPEAERDLLEQLHVMLHPESVP